MLYQGATTPWLYNERTAPEAGIRSLSQVSVTFLSSALFQLPHSVALGLTVTVTLTVITLSNK